ncbi:hypothetical protein Vretimale_5477 [Volvox reticuliferus]|uniref:Centrosomal protein of 131 kDa n=1 Tax=Volvox reticuliferus TaxID=1737510 RepID=A0A8J4G5E8_9CHLO|nr:hypothetical protein Vretimale_5477 [Volvox reticuliferus]
MSSRQQETASTRHATKLPQFPSRKSAIAVGQSPVARARVDSLPGMQPARSPTGRPNPSRGGRTGAEKLQQIGKRKNAEPNKHDHLVDEAGGVDGFESPELAKTRAQVARDEVLSYMNHRRNQRKDTGERANARMEPRDTSFDDFDSDNHRERTAKDSARDPPTPDSTRDPARLLHRVQQALDRWPPGQRDAQHHSSGDDVRPCSADQSPTRHDQSVFEQSAGSFVPGLPACANGVLGCNTNGYTSGEQMKALSSASQASEQCSGTVETNMEHTLDGGSLSEDLFDAFKRELAARVIQTHWRRWQNWKAKLRREAEERILQQLLADDSGLSLQLLLSGSRGGDASCEATDVTSAQLRPNAAERVASGMPQPATRRPTSAVASVSQSNAPNQPSRFVQPCRAGSSGGGLGRTVASSGVEEKVRFVPTRSASATSPTALSRGKSPGRGERVTAPSAASPDRAGRFMTVQPAARCEGSIKRGVSSNSDNFNEDAMGGAGRVHHVQPCRKHTGGHAVYTFLATPSKEAPVATLPAEAAVAQEDFIGEVHQCVTTVQPKSICQLSHTSSSPPAEPFGSSDHTTAGTAANTAPESSAAPSSDLRSQPAAKFSPCPLSPSRQLQPSLDADTNPAMASPALSVGTERSSRDSVLCPVSPVTSVVMPSSHIRSQSQSAMASRPINQVPSSQTQPQQQHPPDCNVHLNGSPRRNVNRQRLQAAAAQQNVTPGSGPALTELPQEQQRPCTASGGCNHISPPMSPSSAQGPPAPLPDLSPSPQRRTRMQALQRLKLQGSLRGTLTTGVPGNLRHPSGPVQSQPPVADGAQELAAQGRHIADRHQDAGPMAPSVETQQPRARRKVWQEEQELDEDAWLQGQEGQRAQGGEPGKYREQQQQQQQRRQPQPPQQPHPQQQHTHGDGEPRVRRHLFDRDQQPRQQSAPATRQHELHQQDLFEEASLRTLNDAVPACNNRRQSGCPPQLQPRPQDPSVATPRGWTQGAGRQMAISPQSGVVRHADQTQEQSQTCGTAHAQLPISEPDRPSGVVAGNEDYSTKEPSVSGPLRVGGLRPVRPVSATAVESSKSRHDAGAGTIPQSRVTVGGDEDSIVQLIGARSQQRNREPSSAGAADRNHAATPTAWLDVPARVGIADPPDRAHGQLLQGQALGTGAPGNTGNLTNKKVGGTAQILEHTTDAGFGDDESCHGASWSSNDGAMGPSSELELAIANGLENPTAGFKHGPGSSSGGGAGGGSCRMGPVNGGGNGRPKNDAQVKVEDSLTAQKISSILKYLDEVEMQAEQEAACAALAPAVLATEPSTAAAVPAALLPRGIVHANQHDGGSNRGIDDGGGHEQRYISSAGTGNSNATRPYNSSARPGTAHTIGSLTSKQRSQAAQSEGGTGQYRSRRRGSQRNASRSIAGNEGDEIIGGIDGEAEDGGVDNDEDDGASVATRSTAAGITNRPAFLAESVYENVRTKIRRLQDDIKRRDARIDELVQEVESMQAARRTCMLDADARLTEMLAAQRAEYEAAVSRHMAFVDRLLADKEALSRRAQQLTEQAKAVEERQERAIAKLKEGWAAELKRQKEAWAAAEKQRREAWMQSKAAEIKDVTVKGLEGEVQKLLARHRAELSAAQKAAADEAKRHLDTYVAQNEAAVRQLKERMSREAEEAVEKERTAAANRLREVTERYEQQLQTQRMRLVADADLRLEQLEQARKEDKKRYEEAVSAAKQAGETRLKEAEEDWRREKEAVRKAHEKQIDALREQYEMGQEGWRAAMAERARKEVSERVAAIREKLLQERNEEVQAVMTRLEAEHAAAVEALKEDFRRREEAAAARAASTLKDARRAEAKMAERFRNAGVSAKAAEERLAASELTVSDLRRELESRNNTIRFLESQVSAAKDEAAARERDVRSLGAEKAAVAAEVAAAVARDKQQVEARLAQALQEAQELRSRHSAEMAAVEARVRTTLARKDEVISGLREQLAAMADELRSTQEVLRQQQEELGSELDGSSNAAAAGRHEVFGEADGQRGGRH